MCPGSAHLRQTARCFCEREALAGLYVSDKNATGLPRVLYHRCWPFHLLMKPFYWTLNRPVFRWHAAFWALLPVWHAWAAGRRLPSCNVVQAIGPFARTAFDHADRLGALKVYDSPSTHPASLERVMRDEYDRWWPGHRPAPGAFWLATEECRRNLARADLVLCPSNHVLDTMVANGVEPAKCVVHPFGADLSVFDPRSGAPPEPRFVSIGYICLRKGHQYLFPAFERIKASFPAAELHCVGGVLADGAPLMRRYRGLVVHHPVLPAAGVAALLKQSTAMVLASVEEGYARVLAEALATGTPLIATAESGAATTITHGSEGMLVPARDPDALHAAMLRLAEDRALAAAMGLRAAARGRALGDWQAYADHLLELYAARARNSTP